MCWKIARLPPQEKIVAFQEGIIDMSGPGAEFNSFSKMNILVPLIYPVEGLDKHTHEATVRIAGLKTAAYMAKTTLGLEPDEEGKYLNMRASWKWDRSIRICPRLYM